MTKAHNLQQFSSVQLNQRWVQSWHIVLMPFSCLTDSHSPLQSCLDFSSIARISFLLSALS
jgi:hypothetical protein